MSARCQFREAIYEQFARIGKAVSSPKRLELLDLLAQGERTVEVLAREADLSVANASQHLQVLKAAGLVETTRQGLFVTYRLADDEVWEFVRSMEDLARHRLAEVDRMTRQIIESNPDLESVDRETLRCMVRDGGITIIDVRPREEYRAGHLRGALCIPGDELDSFLDRLPREQDIVAYCRGRYCVLAVEAVRALRQRGYRAFYIAEGVRDLREHGFEIEQGDDPSPTR